MDNLNKYYKSKNKFTTTINTAYENIDFKNYNLTITPQMKFWF